ncbi:hypothetical protein [Thermoactinomyces sp. CICC 10522]|uniref:hypothetical protein n=1 Tax=Thermoactinomyces sp. CICC 10522 TaxID=2767427 RepID=UPI0018DE54D8|nr:hypothetical protein [Thermoactinomyces sp. CICC 10522]MBH8605612.1 hypothetical protein [Thermoactinomyces sp. CICC 10522]
MAKRRAQDGEAKKVEAGDLMYWRLPKETPDWLLAYLNSLGKKELSSFVYEAFEKEAKVRLGSQQNEEYILARVKGIPITAEEKKWLSNDMTQGMLGLLLVQIMREPSKALNTNLNDEVSATDENPEEEMAVNFADNADHDDFISENTYDF